MHRTTPLWFLLACAGGTDPIEITELSVTEPYPGVAEVSFRSTGGAATVAWGLEGEPTSATIDAGSGPEHAVQLRGLRLGETYTVQAAVDGVEGPAATLAVTPPRGDLPALEREVHEPDATCTGDGGYVLTSMLRLDGGASHVVIYDAEGHPVWSASSELAEWYARARLGRDGDSVLWLHNDPSRVNDLGKITRLSFDGTLLSETRAVLAHHDFVERSDGRLAWLSYEQVEGVDVEGVTRDVAADVILEAPEGGEEGDEEVVFSMLSDYPHPLYDPGLTTAEAGFLPGWWEFSHGNSLMLSEDEDHYYVMFRWLDALAKVDRDGVLQWQLGGRHGDVAWEPHEAFDRPHMSSLWEGGFVVFDNADHSVGVSGPAAYDLDEDARTATRTFEYRDPEVRLEVLLGDVIPMDREGCGSWLVAWSTRGRIEEITATGEVALALQAPPGWIVSRLTWVPALQ